MRILFLSQRFLWPMDTGGKIRTGNILRHLSREHEVTLVSNVDPAIDRPHEEQMGQFCSRFVGVPRADVPKHSLRFYARLFPQVASRYPVSVLNDTSGDLQRAVEREAETGDYDVAVCDFVQSALMFRRVLGGVPTVLFQHNVEAVILERHFRRANNPVSRVFWWLQWRKMLAFEGRACRDFGQVVAVSDTDRDTMRDLYGAERVEAIPTGVDIEYFAPRLGVEAKPNSLVFCGSMDWLPNEDAVDFFAREVLPILQRNNGACTFTVVGRNPSPRTLAVAGSAQGISVTGWVDDTRPFLARAAVCVVPIRIGGGTRMKIYEAMASGLPVVSTSVGAEGLPLRGGTDLLIADEPQQMAAAIAELLGDETRRRHLAGAGMEYVRERFSWNRVAGCFASILETCIADRCRRNGR